MASRLIKLSCAVSVGFAAFSAPGLATELTIYQFRSAAQSGGSGKHDRMSLMMRRRPRVNHEVLLRATFLG